MSSHAEVADSDIERLDRRGSIHIALIALLCFAFIIIAVVVLEWERVDHDEDVAAVVAPFNHVLIWLASLVGAEHTYGAAIIECRDESVEIDGVNWKPDQFIRIRFGICRHELREPVGGTECHARPEA
jgi:hypothetical protein